MAAIPKMNWILLKFYLYVGGRLTNNTLREILSNLIPNFTYNTNERERELCENKLDVFGKEKVRIRFLRLDIIYRISLLIAIVQ